MTLSKEATLKNTARVSKSLGNSAGRHFKSDGKAVEDLPLDDFAVTARAHAILGGFLRTVMHAAVAPSDGTGLFQRYYTALSETSREIADDPELVSILDTGAYFEGMSELGFDSNAH